MVRVEAGEAVGVADGRSDRRRIARAHPLECEQQHRESRVTPYTDEFVREFMVVRSREHALAEGELPEPQLALADIPRDDPTGQPRGVNVPVLVEISQQLAG